MTKGPLSLLTVLPYSTARDRDGAVSLPTVISPAPALHVLKSFSRGQRKRPYQRSSPHLAPQAARIHEAGNTRASVRVGRAKGERAVGPGCS